MAGLVWTERHLNGREVPTAGRDHLLLIDRGAPLPDRLGADARIRSVLLDPDSGPDDRSAACPNASPTSVGRYVRGGPGDHGMVYRHYATCVRPLIHELAGGLDLDSARAGAAAGDRRAAAAVALYDQRPFQIESEIPYRRCPSVWRIEEPPSRDTPLCEPDPFATWHHPLEDPHILLDDPSASFTARAEAGVTVASWLSTPARAVPGVRPAPCDEPPYGPALYATQKLVCPEMQLPGRTGLPFVHAGVCITRLVIDAAPRMDVADAHLAAGVFDMVASTYWEVRISGGSYRIEELWEPVADRLREAATSIVDAEARAIFTSGVDATMRRGGGSYYGGWRPLQWPPDAGPVANG